MKPSGFAYSFLKEMVNLGDYNFYGIIYDATYPSLEEHSSSQKMYECSIKLIDPSMNCLTSFTDISSNSITLIIKSNIKECMPFIHSIGDIIRVHCGSYVIIYHLYHLLPLESNKENYQCDIDQYNQVDIKLVSILGISK